MEAAMPLYGHDMNDDISPKIAGLGFAIKMDKPDFTTRFIHDEKHGMGYHGRR